jgi:hypothetical protein
VTLGRQQLGRELFSVTSPYQEKLHEPAQSE